MALQPDKALIFRIVHVDNLPWMVEHGLQCRNAENPNPDFVSIGSQELIDNRRCREVPIPPGGTYGDYTPFYFTPYSIMMYNIKTGYGVPKRSNDEIIICVSSLYDIEARGQEFVFTNQHGCSQTDLKFSSDTAELEEYIDWNLLRSRDFKNDLDDPGKGLRYQAEAMVRGDIPLEVLRGIVCYSDTVLSTLTETIHPVYPNLNIQARPTWYF